jgi:protocatechuate 3,4-dioxygenase beta subunit
VTGRRRLASRCLRTGLVALLLVAARLGAAQAPSRPSTRGQASAEGGALAGTVRDLKGMPVAKAVVAVSGVERTVESDAAGRFEVVGVSVGEHQVRVARPGFEALGFTVHFPEPGRLEVDLALQDVAVAAAVPPSAAPLLLSGRVVDDTGAPIAEAEIGLMGSPATAVADSAGRFRFADLPPGPYLLSVRRLGFAPRTISVTLRASASEPVVVRLERQVATLAPTTVTGTRGRENYRLADFYDRKAKASGVFIEQEEIERRRPAQFTDLFRANTTLTVQRDRTGRQYVESRLVGTGRCLPAVFIDGVYHRQEPGLLDAMAPPDQVRAVEVYNGRASVPGAFSRPGTDCGVIAVWTK